MREGAATMYEACFLERSESAQQRRNLTAGRSIQKTVQGELGSAKRDARRKAKIRARVGVPICDTCRHRGTQHVGEGLLVGEAAALALAGKQLGCVVATQIFRKALQYRRRCRADIDFRGGGRQRGYVGRDFAIAI